MRRSCEPRRGGRPGGRWTKRSRTSSMPRRTDLQRILLLGSGPIVIGQAAEFDYSGTQAVKALKEEGYTVVLVNSNPATIMTEPALVRPCVTLGGTGGAVAFNRAEVEEAAERALELLPVHTTLIARSVLRWKEFELEVMLDRRDNVVIVCSIENLDPMGVHTGDSITVAPAMTLSDREYQRMRDAAIAIIREIGVEAGGCNIQFAVNPPDGRMLAIEMNPRVSRSSALASKATGLPIARIGTKLAVGYRLHELPNDITKTTPASFEPVLASDVVKVPRFAFEKFPTADFRLTTQMKSVGEAMAIGRTFKEAFQKGLRALEIGRPGWVAGASLADDRLTSTSPA